MAIKVAALHTYPVKSCRGTDWSTVEVNVRGFQDDRTLMLVDADGRFMSQREDPRMSLIVPCLDSGRLTLQMAGQPTLVLTIQKSGARSHVAVWRDVCIGIDQGDVAASWLKAALGVPARLVRMADDCVRRCDPTYALRANDQTAFSDGFPILLISEASLDDLNTRLDRPLPMNRFRPNLVVSGCAPYAEDTWTRIRVCGIEFDVVKPCSRCAITTTDQATAERAKEPLRTLATYRKYGNDVFFGQNVIHAGTGRIEVGAEVEVLGLRTA